MSTGTKEELEAAITEAKQKLTDAEAALFIFESSAENNVFDTLENALYQIEEKLCDQAREDCEGSHNCGAETYAQEFIVAGVHYLGTLKCEYGRHDKTYYFLDEREFSCEEIKTTTYLPPTIEMIPVESSNLLGFGHDSVKTLRVWFKNGTRYDYIGLPESDFFDLVNAESAGKAYNALMKERGIKGVKL